MNSTGILKNFFINFLKLVIFLVHLLSTIPFVFIFLIILIIALFCENDHNYFVKFSQIFVCFLIISSILLFIALNFNQTFSFFSELVGSSFLDPYFPPSKTGIRALFPVAFFVSTICILFAVDYYSLKYFDHVDYQDVENMREQMRNLYSDGKPLEGLKQADLTVERTHKILYNKGILTQIVNNNKIATFIEYFNKK